LNSHTQQTYADKASKLKEINLLTDGVEILDDEESRRIPYDSKNKVVDVVYKSGVGIAAKERAVGKILDDSVDAAGTVIKGIGDNLAKDSDKFTGKAMDGLGVGVSRVTTDTGEAVGTLVKDAGGIISKETGRAVGSVVGAGANAIDSFSEVVSGGAKRIVRSGDTRAEYNLEADRIKKLARAESVSDNIMLKNDIKREKREMQLEKIRGKSAGGAAFLIGAGLGGVLGVVTGSLLLGIGVMCVGTAIGAAIFSR
jgi:hypothetical protein